MQRTARILQIYFSVAHDPTQLNRQGPAVGTLPFGNFLSERRTGTGRERLYCATQSTRVYPAAIVTKIEPDREFYAAEDYHQDFVTTHPTYPYIVYNDLPKIEDLKHIFPDH